MMNGNAANFQREMASSPSWLEGTHVSLERAVYKARLISILVVCSGSPQRKVHYADLAEAMGISCDEVEDWVVRAIRMNLLDARLDQVSEVVVVYRSLHQVFTNVNWTELRTKLRGIRDALGDMNSVLASERSTALPRGNT